MCVDTLLLVTADCTLFQRFCAPVCTADCTPWICADTLLLPVTAERTLFQILCTLARIPCFAAGAGAAFAVALAAAAVVLAALVVPAETVLPAEAVVPVAAVFADETVAAGVGAVVLFAAGLVAEAAAVFPLAVVCTIAVAGEEFPAALPAFCSAVVLPVLPAETVFCAAGAVLSWTAALPCAAAAAACVFLPEESAELLTVPYCADTGSVFLWLSHHVLTLLVMEEIRLVLFAELELVLLPALVPALLVVLLADPALVLPVLVAEALPADDDDLLLDVLVLPAFDVLVLPVLVLLLLLLLPDELEVPEDELLLPVEDDDEDEDEEELELLQNPQPPFTARSSSSFNSLNAVSFLHALPFPFAFMKTLLIFISLPAPGGAGWVSPKTHAGFGTGSVVLCLEPGVVPQQVAVILLRTQCGLVFVPGGKHVQPGTAAVCKLLLHCFRIAPALAADFF